MRTEAEFKNHTNQIFTVQQENFEALALELFRFQFEHNALYRSYCLLRGINPDFISTLTQIPFLPIQFFKTHRVQCFEQNVEIIFESSGTGGSTTSKHYVNRLDIYVESFSRCFQQFYGSVTDYCILGLLPSYLERQQSSLVYMVNHLINESKHEQSRFYLYDQEGLHAVITQNEAEGKKTLLIGVSYALIDFFEKYPLKLKHCIVMETGGMKGRRTEITRETLHELLCRLSGSKTIHAEYGMTELLSQAYATEIGLFSCPPWMKVLIRETDDPLSVISSNNIQTKSIQGAVNIIDLANWYSCSFIATEDVGKLYPDGRFEILGRLDNSDIRGCSLLTA